MKDPAGIFTEYDSDILQISFYAEYGKDDCLDNDSIEILSIHLFGIPVSFSKLEKDLQAAILNLHSETL